MSSALIPLNIFIDNALLLLHIFTYIKSHRNMKKKLDILPLVYLCLPPLSNSTSLGEQVTLTPSKMLIFFCLSTSNKKRQTIY